MNQKFIFIMLALALWSIDCIGQTIAKPNHSLKSHETLEINKIETTSKSTVFYMSVENRTTG
ncbi:MAG TPA: hypothetical protein VMW76_06680, partial [Bacteroidales bacterium]|nr:hypothetical protein [Bacteroidales bacterium]